ncbi:MAG: DUF6706 family protein [Leifsonia sp.]
MTNLEALQSIVVNNYPFDQNLFAKALIDNGIDATATYVADNQKPIDLCFAGILITAITNVDISEGGYKVTNADRQSMIAVINGIYAKYGLPLFTAGAVFQNGSNKW